MAIFRPVSPLYLQFFLVCAWKDYQSKNKDNRQTLHRERKRERESFNVEYYF